WLHTLRPQKNTRTLKDMVVKEEQALEAQGFAALSVRKKALKTFEVFRMKMGIDEP
ncbi:hypothetical protein H4582DRAFT_1769631, partial [Lactarius indigo]